MQPVRLTVEDQQILESWQKVAAQPQRMKTRAHIILSLAEGKSGRQIARELGIHRSVVQRWAYGFRENGFKGLYPTRSS